jgi:hypothetical protein
MTRRTKSPLDRIYAREETKNLNNPRKTKREALLEGGRRGASLVFLFKHFSSFFCLFLFFFSLGPVLINNLIKIKGICNLSRACVLFGPNYN